MLVKEDINNNMLGDLLKLSSWLTAQNNIEILLTKSLERLEELSPIDSACFCIIDESSLIYQAGSQNIDLKNAFLSFQKNINKVEEIFQEEDLCFAPIFINEKLVALILIKTKEEFDLESLGLFAKIFSSVLSSLQQREELESNYQETLEQNKIKTDLLATISHELRTPMANILGFSELLSIKDFDKDQEKEYLDEIHKAAQRLSNMIANFLDLARIEDNKARQISSFTKSDIKSLAKSAWAQIKHINKNYDLKLECDENLEKITVDAEAITRVFINLFTNAIKYAPDSQKVICFIKKRRNSFEINVKDSGQGIDSSELEMIFKRFYRSEKQNNKAIQGTGLGLWICKEIVEAHQGKIWCESEVNSGSTFYITLPIDN